LINHCAPHIFLNSKEPIADSCWRNSIVTSETLRRERAVSKIRCTNCKAEPSFAVLLQELLWSFNRVADQFSALVRSHESPRACEAQIIVEGSHEETRAATAFVSPYREFDDRDGWRS
jgi:hypothetical protein